MANQVARNLQKLVDIKKDIKSALEEKNRTPTNEFSTYANEIRSLITGGGIIPEGEKEITSTESVDVTTYATARVVDENLTSGNIAEGVSILGVVGTHTCVGGVEIPTITDLVVSQEGIATWTAPDITSLAEYNPVISYLVSVNNKEAIETSDTTLNVRLVLEDGTNNISVIVKAILTNNKNTSTTIEYSKPTEAITTLSTTLLSSFYASSSAAVGNNIYIFGGRDGYGLRTGILKFDTSTETITTLNATMSGGRCEASAAAVGTNIYIFGGIIMSGGTENISRSILKFDTDTETVTTLSSMLNTATFGSRAISVGTNIYVIGGEIDKQRNFSTLLYKFDSEALTISSTILYLYNSNMAAELVGSDIYLFGGNGLNGGSYITRDTIIKLDTTTETITYLSNKLPYALASSSSASFGDNIYIFGGYSSKHTNAILKFNTKTEKITTLDITLPKVCIGLTSSVSNENAYIFGGYNYENGQATYLNTILKFTV